MAAILHMLNLCIQSSVSVFRRTKAVKTHIQRSGHDDQVGADGKGGSAGGTVVKKLIPYGGYYTIGRAFVELIGHPQLMRIMVRHGLPHPTLMRFALKLMANLAEPRGGDAADRVINALSRLAPAS